MAIVKFPKDFLWGASTASYQIEGGNEASALWDWEARKRWERSGEAARSWELFEEDLGLLKSLNLNAYRFSIEWSRVEPRPGVVDEAVLERYASWAGRLAQEGIRPFVCLHHFSEPAWLLREHPRGWLDPAVPSRFLSFVELCVAALKGTVADWLVFNEPMVFLVAAYGAGMFPPGRYMLTNVKKEFNPVLVKSMAEAHNKAYEAIRRQRPDANIGVAQNIARLEPASPRDEAAVRDWDWFMHRHFLDLIKDRMDFLGINYYTRIYVRKSPLPFLPMGVLPGYAEFERALTRPVFRLLGGRRGDRPRTGMGWEIAPEGLETVVRDYWRAYGKPIYITENGLADASGELREEYIRTHLEALARAMSRGADVRGYLHWSLMDNYEWGSYKPKFGLFSRERKPSGGSRYYARVAQTGQL